MPSRSIPAIAGPRLRAVVLLLSAVLVLLTTMAVSSNVSDHLRQAAVNEAVRATESVVLGYMDDAVLPAALADPGGPAGNAVNARLENLVRAGKILRIKVWSA